MSYYEGPDLGWGPTQKFDPTMTGETMTRQEHLQFSKDRALEVLDTGDVAGAAASFYSDLGSHPETAGHPVIELMFMHQMNGLLTEREARSLIEGTN